MKPRRLPRPTEAELEILSVLWERGPSTVREVFAALPAERRTGYTSVLKFMQIMAGKGLVTRQEDQRAHVYQARVTREQTQRQLIAHLADRAFGGSALQLAQQALASAGRATPEDLAEIRKMLDDYERSRS
ncbi:MAG TPA: BlaI/MecI/CopY family transcriptional regulator [Bryobacteraceae bacterium]|nr:BlaI/MecI/CopY family transcriptional regulator [Bryobacteraceae bacterium]